jgi:hypothetical protein
LTGAADAQLAVKRGGDGLISVTVEWLKDGDDGHSICSQLRTVEVGRDAGDGSPITSCVIEPADDGQTRVPVAKLSPRQRRALDKLRELVAESGKVPPTSRHIPPSKKTVALDLVLVALAKTDVVAAVAQEKHRKQTLARIIEQLKDKGVVGSYGDEVWVNA